MKRFIVLLLTVCIAVPLAACGGQQAQTKGKVKISIGEWPNQNQPALVERYNEYLKEFTAKYPDIEVTPDEWRYDVNSFVPKAAAGMLPTMYSTYLTEVGKIISAGYAADATETVKNAGFYDTMNASVRDLLTKDGRLYGIASGTYSFGLIANAELFRQAGLLDENGVPKFPRTYDELAQTASEIKKKTGKPGFVFPSINNVGGWTFMNTAWSFGVNFMEQDASGKWKASFNTPEMVAALTYLKDLKWKHDVLPDNALVDQSETQKLMATDQVGMYLCGGAGDAPLFLTYSMNKDHFALNSVPAGKAGQYALTGGNAWMFSSAATPEQIDACLKWLNFIGKGPERAADWKEKQEAEFKSQLDKGQVVGPRGQPAFGGEQYERELSALYDKYANIDNKFYEGYNDTNVKIRPEEPMNCQDLYKILDACIQEVFTNKNADPAALIEKASNDFQTNYLDKAE